MIFIYIFILTKLNKCVKINRMEIITTDSLLNFFLYTEKVINFSFYIFYMPHTMHFLK